jgi:CRP-like cAMP-binding protein
MPAKSSPSLIKRFVGAAGRKRFVEVLQEQEIVAGNKQLARRLAAVTTRRELPANHEFLTQGNSDNELYFILCGSVAVKVNGREVATRGAGEHLGEMALLDTTARRSATARTLEPTVVAKVAESKFTQIAQAYPDLWRRTAVALARRLRERNKFQTPPRSQPVIFIGSSIETRING